MCGELDLKGEYWIVYDEKGKRVDGIDFLVDWGWKTLKKTWKTKEELKQFIIKNKDVLEKECLIKFHL